MIVKPGVKFISQAEVKCQSRRWLPVVLDIERVRRIVSVKFVLYVRIEVCFVGNPQQKGAEGISDIRAFLSRCARNGAGEGILAELVGVINVLTMGGEIAEVSSDLDGVGTLDPSQVVQDLLRALP